METIHDSLSTSLLIVLFLVFPDGRFVPRWMRWVAFGVVGIQAWRIFQPDAYQSIFMLVIATIIVIPLSLLYRYLRVATPIQRRQIKWVVLGISLAIIPLALYGVLYATYPGCQEPTAQGAACFLLGFGWWNVTLILLPLSFTLAILRSRLWDIDVIIRKTLVYSVLTSLLALVYFGMVILLQAFLGRALAESSALVIVLSTLFIAALFAPLRRRVQNIIDRRFFRRKYDAQQVLARFADNARQETDPDRLTAELVNVIQETLQPQGITLWLKPAVQNERRPHNPPS